MDFLIEYLFMNCYCIWWIDVYNRLLGLQGIGNVYRFDD